MLLLINGMCWIGYASIYLYKRYVCSRSCGELHEMCTDPISDAQYQEETDTQLFVILLISYRNISVLMMRMGDNLFSSICKNAIK